MQLFYSRVRPYPSPVSSAIESSLAVIIPNHVVLLVGLLYNLRSINSRKIKYEQILGWKSDVHIRVISMFEYPGLIAAGAKGVSMFSLRMV